MDIVISLIEATVVVTVFAIFGIGIGGFLCFIHDRIRDYLNRKA